MDGITQKQWGEVIENARFMLEEYKKIPTGIFGASFIANDIALYEAGDRSEALYESLKGIN